MPESWTTLYFDLWRFFIVWGLLDRDPAFGAGDRAVVEELLWNYWQVLDGDRNFPHFRADVMVPGEIRQNHTTFLALDLFCAHRYYREKYGMTGLERLRGKYGPAMSAQLEAVHGNDDAGFGYWGNLVFGYIYLAPNHALLYRTLQGDEEYLAAPHLRKFADLLVTATDNRRDGASFGDVSGYDHRAAGLPRGMTEKYLELAAAAERDGQFHWVYEWLAHDSGFELVNLFDGEYAIRGRGRAAHPLPRGPSGSSSTTRPSLGRPPGRKEDLHPRGRTKTISTRCLSAGFRRRRRIPSPRRHVDLRPRPPGRKYGVRLTWKDRIWLFDLDYINHTPRYHNGLVVTRNGVQRSRRP